jgi:small subunit ribosomal protein S1
MNDQTEVPVAPANAVEANQGATPQGDTSPTNVTTNTETPHEASGGADVPTEASSGGAPAPSPEGAEAAGEGDDAEGGDEEGEGEAGGEAAAGAPGEPGKKKRRRRRRKKGPHAAAQPGADGAAPGEPGQQPHAERAPKEGPGGVFARFFEGAHGAKRHAFAAGEVVAGRVSRLNENAFSVDLFGKATAFVDIFEPREVPHIPEPSPEPAPASTEGAPTPSGSETAPATDDVVEGQVAVPVPGEAGAGAAPTEGTPAEAPAAEAAPAEAASEAAPEAAPADAAPEAARADAAPADAAPAEAAPAEAATAEVEAAHEEHEEHHDEHAHEEHVEEPEPEPPAPPALGEIFRGRIGYVAESGHIAIVNRLIDVGAAKQKLLTAREQRRRVRGLVFGFNRGGFDVLVEGIRVFCPASGMSLGPVDNPEELLGDRVDFTVPPAKAGTHGLVVSRRGILERQMRKAAKHLLRSLQPGQRLKGRVTQVREFGLFVDLGGIEGLVHQSELSFSRGVRPNDAAKVGDEIEVQVLRVGEGQTRRERERVSLSLKALQADPWSAHHDLLEPGTVHTGKVVRTTEFGAFIELAPQIEGLLHISELGRELKHANQAINEGDEVRVVVERTDLKQRRISLSKLSQAEEKALEAGGDAKSGRPPKPGQHITVVVDKVEHAGLIVQVPGVFGRRGRGFIPNSEMGTERGTDHRKGFPQGKQIPVKVIGIDRDGGFRFSRKALMHEEEKRAVQDYRKAVASQGLGTFGDLLRKKLEGKS